MPEPLSPAEREALRSVPELTPFLAFLSMRQIEQAIRAALAAVPSLGHEAGEREELAALKDALASGEASDGYHTHRELYSYRMLYNAHAAQGWLAAGVPVVKSWRHSDGEPCFGGGWFVVVATLPTGQVSNHYKAEHWTLFDVPVVHQPPAWDGHTPAVAEARLLEALSPYATPPGRSMPTPNHQETDR